MSAIPLSFVIGSPFAGWILSHQWLAVQGWRWLFLLEGLPAIVLGAVAFFFLTDWPHEAAWLPLSERNWIEQKLKNEKLAGAAEISVWLMLRSRTVLLLACCTFLNYFATYIFVFWFPTLLKRQSGLSDIHVGMLGAIPYFVTFVAMLINGWHSDKSRERRWHSAAPLFIAAIGLLGLISQPGSLWLMLVLSTMACISIVYLPVFWAIPSELLGPSAAGAVGMINSVGSIAGFAGPYIFGYLNTATGTFSYGLTLMTLAAMGGGLLILCTPKPVARVHFLV